VKSWELLSDPEKRRAYDFDAARGDTEAYAREARGQARNGRGSYEGWDDPRNYKKAKSRRTG
jgi:DnaJ-class molecular chaperone